MKDPSLRISIASIAIIDRDHATARTGARRASGGAASASLPFDVELPLFSGPFRLLATLILEQKLDVCDVPVAAVTESFLRRGLEESRRWSLEEATWFIATCAALLELKVGRLLRRPGADVEDDLVGGVAPDVLYARSLELAAFRRLAVVFSDRLAAAAAMVPRSAGPPPEYGHLYPDIMDRITPSALQSTALSLFGAPRAVDLSHVAPIRASLSQALETVKKRLSVLPEARFRDLLSGCTERIEVVVRFLALLELYREGKIEMVQAVMFGDIEVRWQSGPEPSV